VGLKSHYVNVTMAGDDLAKVEGDEKIIGLLAVKMEAATMTAQDDFATYFFSDGTGNATKDFDGLLNGADNGTLYSTYGGIDRSTNAWWDGVVDSTGGAVTIDAINSMVGSLTIGTKKPDLALQPRPSMTRFGLVSNLSSVSSERNPLLLRLLHWDQLQRSHGDHRR